MTSLLTTEEVAQRLKVDVKTVLALADSNRLPSYSIGSRLLRFKHDEVNAYRMNKAPLVPLELVEHIASLRADLFGSVYFVASDDYVKIGFTAKPMSYRMKHMQTGNPIKLQILHVVMNVEHTFEKVLHQKFIGLQFRKEWFRAKGELLHPSGDKIATLPKFITALAADKAKILEEWGIAWGRNA